MANTTGSDAFTLRIYLHLSDREPPGEARWPVFRGRLYQRIIRCAKAEGIGSAFACQCCYGYNRTGALSWNDPELGNGTLPSWVELHAELSLLQTFCAKFEPLLRGLPLVMQAKVDTPPEDRGSPHHNVENRCQSDENNGWRFWT